MLASSSLTLRRTHVHCLPPRTPPARQCATKADCLYNGDCNPTTGVCDCIPQFKGARCGIFNFAPLDLSKGAGLRTVDGSGQQVSSWGGYVNKPSHGEWAYVCVCRDFVCSSTRTPHWGASYTGAYEQMNSDIEFPSLITAEIQLTATHESSRIIERVSCQLDRSVHASDDGRLHMWAAEMSDHVGIKAWITNSQVVHAVVSVQPPPPLLPCSAFFFFGLSVGVRRRHQESVPQHLNRRGCHSATGGSRGQADAPDKPFSFTRKEVVMPVFAHEPTVSRAPTGEWVM